MKACVVITSIVEIGTAPLDWVPVRSIYSHQQRFEQTLETIQSVRTRLPDADIILVECSPDSHYMTELASRVDVFLNAYPNDMVRTCRNKSLGEATLLLHTMTHADLSQYTHIFKLTGRYVLTDAFNPSAWVGDSPIACLSDWYTTAARPGLHMHTFFYKLTQDDLELVQRVLQGMVISQTGESIEHEMYAALRSRLQIVPEIGIQVRWSSFTATPHA